MVPIGTIHLSKLRFSIKESRSYLVCVSDSQELSDSLDFSAGLFFLLFPDIFGILWQKYQNTFNVKHPSIMIDLVTYQ